MFKETLKQRAARAYLVRSRALIIGLLKLHHKVANVGIEEHPCWAGGFGPNGIESQPCKVCDPFYQDHSWFPERKDCR